MAYLHQDASLTPYAPGLPDAWDNTPGNVAAALDELRSESELLINHTAEMNDDHAFEIICDAAGFSDVKAIDIDYITGAIASGEEEGVILVNIDEVLAAGGSVAALEVIAT
jgi:hypothetical protein